MATDVRVDHDEAESVAKKLDQLADDLSDMYTTSTAKIGEAMDKEASAYTRDSNPAPVFMDVNRAIEALLTERVQARVDAICEKMRNDAEALRQFVSDASEVGDETAAAENQVNADI